MIVALVFGLLGLLGFVVGIACCVMDRPPIDDSEWFAREQARIIRMKDDI